MRTVRAAQGGVRPLVCGEAGASVRFNAKLVDMNIAVPANDAKTVKVLATGPPLFHGPNSRWTSHSDVLSQPRNASPRRSGGGRHRVPGGEGGRWSPDFIERQRLTTQSAMVSFSLSWSSPWEDRDSRRRSNDGAHWASWAECLPMVHERHPAVAEIMVKALASRDPAPCHNVVKTCAWRT